MRKNLIPVAIAGGVAALLITCGAVVASATNESGTPKNAQPTGSGPAPSGKNARGETYGSALSVKAGEPEPDLIEAIGSNGKLGYVRKSDLNAGDARTLQEARASVGKVPKPRSIPLYESDGVTVIGEFVMPNITTAEEAAAYAKAHS